MMRLVGLNTVGFAAAACLLAPSAVFASPVLVNGSFEANVLGSPFRSSLVPTGWNHTGTFGDSDLWAIGYSDGGGSVTVAGAGNQFATLGDGFTSGIGFAGLDQVITGLTPGNSYRVDFMTATELGTGLEPGGPQSLTVTMLSGSSSGPQTFTSPVSSTAYWATWVNQTYLFTATTVSADIQFSITNQPYDIGLDNVRVSDAAVSTVPEPSTLLLLAPGVVALVKRRLGGRRV